MTTKAPMFAMTMVYNENHNLQRWINYYGVKVGLGSLYIIDHGTNDGSTCGLDNSINIIRIPREEFDDAQRLKLVQGFFNGLLEYFDTGLFADADEFVVPDPEKYSDIFEYSKRMNVDCVYAVGLNIVEIMNKDAPFRTDRPILGQRDTAVLSNSMCKPLLAKAPIAWNPGFHTSSADLFFDPDLFLMHTKYASKEEAYARLSVTRQMKWSDDALQKNVGRHQRWRDDELEARYNSYDKRYCMNDLTPFDFVIDCNEMVRDAWKNKAGLWVRDNRVPERMVNIPERFFSVGV